MRVSTLLWYAAILAPLSAFAQQPFETSGLVQADEKGSSTAQRSARAWQLEAFVAGGYVPSYTNEIPMDPYAGVHFRIRLDLLNAGFSGGKMVTALHGPGILHGRGEVAFEILPFWLANYPRQTITVQPTNDEQPSRFIFPALQRYGVSATPVLYRWNFMREEMSRISPWAQLGGGLLWTNHKFPVVPLTNENTSVINFTPQVGIGETVFVKRNRSLDFAVKAIHISNASLGDNNPGINISLQFSAGYSWWK